MLRGKLYCPAFVKVLLLLNLGSLDHFFVNKILSDGKDLEISLRSFEIYSPAFITEDHKKKIHRGEEIGMKLVRSPKHFKPEAKTKDKIGYSDHFPIMAKLVYP